MLKVEDLWVAVEGRELLKGINLHIPAGETHILFGKNGSGKSTLIMTVMGFASYSVKKGAIYFRGQEITHLPPSERAQLGLGLAFQRPPTIRGVKVRDILKACAGSRDYQDIVTQYNFTSFLDREVNYGFSGGELKRSELLQLLAQDPLMVLLDEPESGVDLENLQVVGAIIARLLQKERRHRHRIKSGLIITHTGFILNYLEADRGYIMMDGQIYCQGQPREMFNDIKQFGYEECSHCRKLSKRQE